MPRRLPKEIIQALDATGLEWRMENGTKHNKIYIGPHLILVISKGSGTKDPFLIRNNLREIKHKVREIKEG